MVWALLIPLKPAAPKDSETMEELIKAKGPEEWERFRKRGGW